MSQLARHISDVTPFPGRQQFSVYLSINQTNTTGDGTTYIVPFDTKDYDIGNTYSTGTNLFTAPTAGLYLFSWVLTVANIASTHTSGSIILTASGAITSYIVETSNYASLRTNAFFYFPAGSQQIKMAAGETMRLDLAVSNGTKTIAVNATGGAVRATTFKGFFLG